MAQTPPTRVSYTESASWITGAASKATGTISWNAGDVLVVIAVDEDPASGQPALPTAPGLTFTSLQTNGTAATCGSRLSSATAASTSSGAVTVTKASPTVHWGFGVWVWRGSDGIGNTAEQHTTTRTVAVTAAGGADSAFVWGAGDWSVAAAGTPTPTATNTDESTVDAGHYTIVVADLIDQTSAGSVSYGVTGSVGGVMSLLVCEIKGTAAVAGDILRPFPVARAHYTPSWVIG